MFVANRNLGSNQLLNGTYNTLYLHARIRRQVIINWLKHSLLVRLYMHSVCVEFIQKCTIWPLQEEINSDGKKYANIYNKTYQSVGLCNLKRDTTYITGPSLNMNSVANKHFLGFLSSMNLKRSACASVQYEKSHYGNRHRILMLRRILEAQNTCPVVPLFGHTIGDKQIQETRKYLQNENNS